MTDLEKLIEATRLTDEVLVARGFQKGGVDLHQYFVGDVVDNKYAFTSHVINSDGKIVLGVDMTARKMMEDVDRTKLLFEIEAKILENAANCAFCGVTKTNNELINLIMAKAKLDLSTQSHSFFDMVDYIKNLLKDRSSDEIINAIVDNIKVLELSEDIHVFKKEAALLSGYAELVNPDKEIKSFYMPKSDDSTPSR